MQPGLTVASWPSVPGPDTETTIGAALADAARRWPDRVALVEGDLADTPRSWTFAALHTRAVRAAGVLGARFPAGSRVAVWSPNCPEWVLLQLAAALAGVVLVTVNPALGAGEAEYVLTKSRAEGLFFAPTVPGRDHRPIAECLVETVPHLREALALTEWATAAGDAGDAGGPGTALPQVRPADPAQIQFTSGTTGFPKGALLAHRGLALNARVFAEAIGARPGDVWVNPMPLFHTAGCGLATLGALQTGATQILPAQFDADLMLDLFDDHRATLLLCVPTMLIRMLEAQRTRPRQLDSWRLVALGGAPVPPELVRRAERELGVEVGIGFGQTESSPYVSHTLPRDPHPTWFETVGRPLPSVEVKIEDPLTRQPAAVDTVGEICTRGVCVMLEYVDDPDATAAAIDQDGWLHTGDLASMDGSGYLRIQGRLRDLIIRGGENVYPREVEDVLFAHDDVSSAAVVGLPDPEWGEIVAAFVQLRPGRTASAEDLAAFCRHRLAGYKVPRVWQFTGDFPQTASGKIQKYRLREQYLADHPT